MGNLHAILRKTIQTTSKSKRESYAEQGPHCRGCPDDGGSLHPVLAGESITGHGDDGKTPQREPRRPRHQALGARLLPAGTRLPPLLSRTTPLGAAARPEPDAGLSGEPARAP